MVIIYGGAIHNDPHPETGWDEVAFGPSLFSTTQGNYVEVDLYVPEFIEKNPMMKKEKWYPLFEKHAAKDKVVIIKRNKDAYSMILKRGVLNEPAPTAAVKKKQ